MSYADEYTETISGLQQGALSVRVLGRGAPPPITEFVAQLAEAFAESVVVTGDIGEVFIELDRQVIASIQSKIAIRPPEGKTEPVTDLLPYLYPIAIRVDEYGDIIIHITDAERATQ